MRFITEFELDPDVIDRTRSYRDYTFEKMNILEKKMGELIAIAFHWNVPDKMETGKYKLEIEAFPMDKWIEFKQKLAVHINDSSGIISPNYILSLFKELES